MVLSSFTGSLPINNEEKSANKDIISEPLPILSQGISFGHGTQIFELGLFPSGKDAEYQSTSVEAPSPFSRLHMLSIHSKLSGYSSPGHSSRLYSVAEEAPARGEVPHECVVIQNKEDSDKLSKVGIMRESEIHPTSSRAEIHPTRSTPPDGSEIHLVTTSRAHHTTSVSHEGPHDTHNKGVTMVVLSERGSGPSGSIVVGSRPRSQDQAMGRSGGSIGGLHGDRGQEGPISFPHTQSSSSGPLWRFQSESTPSPSGGWPSEGTLDLRMVTAGTAPGFDGGARSCRDSPRVSGALKKLRGISSSALVSTLHHYLS